jgi:hypothetical protein
MDLKTALAEARSTLATAATDWTPPPRQQITADPMLCASLFRIGIRRGLPDLANRAAATLLVFDPDRLWRELIRAAVEDIGTPHIDHLWETMAAAKDRRWRRVRGGDWHVATMLIDRLARAPKCRSAIDLARLARFSEVTDPVVERGREQLKVRVISEVSGAPTCSPYASLEALAEAGVPWLWLDGASRARSVCGSPAALMLPLLWGRQTTRREAEAEQDAPEKIALAALTHETPGGRRALSAQLAHDGELRETVMRLRFAQADPIDTLGAWVAQLDFDRVDHQPRFEHPGVTAALNTASSEGRTWPFNGADIIAAKLPAIDARRRSYLPLNLIRNDRP